MAPEPPRTAVGAARFALMLVTAGVTLPAIVVCAYVLVWFAPELTSPGECPTSSVWLDNHDSTILWLAGAAGAGAASTLLVVALRRMRGRRWWVWPLACLVSMAFMLAAISRIGEAAWCRMS
jgi:hypothetical protein